jgi:DNA replication protein DnaC
MSDEQIDARLFRQRCPREYLHCTEENSPRPAQFKFVQSYWIRDDPEDDSPRKPGLILFGPPGAGKTAAVWALIKRNRGQYWATWLFLKTVRLTTLAKGRHLSASAREEFLDVFNEAMSVELLALDDLGSEKLSETAEEMLFELLDHRTERHATTLITCNYKAPELASKFPRNRDKIMRRLTQYFVPVNFGVQAPAGKDEE